MKDPQFKRKNITSDFYWNATDLNNFLNSVSHGSYVGHQLSVGKYVQLYI